MQRLGAGGTLWILCLIGGTGLLVLLGLRTDSHSPEQTAGIRDALARTRKGLRYVRGNSAILGTLIITVIMNAWAFPFQALLPVFARDVLGQGPFGLGLLGAANGAGAMVGLLLVNLSRRSFGHPAIFSTGSILACVGLLAFSLSSSMTLSLAALAIAGVGQAGFSIMQSSIILVEATDEMRSRAMGALVLAIGMLVDDVRFLPRVFHHVKERILRRDNLFSFPFRNAYGSATADKAVTLAAYGKVFPLVCVWVGSGRPTSFVGKEKTIIR